MVDNVIIIIIQSNNMYTNCGSAYFYLLLLAGVYLRYGFMKSPGD